MPRGYGSHAETRHRRAVADVVPRRGRHAQRLRPVLPAAESRPRRRRTVRVRYLRPDAARRSRRRTSLAAAAALNIWVNVEEFDRASATRCASTDVSAVFDGHQRHPDHRRARDVPARRPGSSFGAGHESAGVTAPAPQWFLAEGATGTYFDLFVLIANPSRHGRAGRRATYLLPDGRTVSTTDHGVAANSRFNIWVDHEESRGSASAGRHRGLDDRSRRPTACRSSSSGRCGGRAASRTWYEAHNSPGATATGHAVGAGRRRGRRRARRRDVHPDRQHVGVRRHRPGDAAVRGRHDARSKDVRAAARSSRINVAVRSEFPSVAGQALRRDRREPSARTPAQIVVERAVYGNAGGEIWAAGTNALATRLR